MKKCIRYLGILFYCMCTVKGYAFFESCWPDTIACKSPLARIYFGGEGGWNTGVTRPTPAFNTGATAVGFSNEAKARAGYHGGASVGYWLYPCLRLDVSYNFLSNPYAWFTAFPVGFSFYDSRLHSHVVLVNGYWQLNNVCNSCIRYSPYVTGGIGTTWNYLFDVNELNAFVAGRLVSFIDSHTVNHFAARFGIGFLKFTRSKFVWDFGGHVYYLGKIRSGNFRTLPNGTTQTIVPYKFQQNWSFALYAGLKYGL